VYELTTVVHDCDAKYRYVTDSSYRIGCVR